ncbi:GNAT family N-acetyltransferase [Streptomonospora sp. S1-112]|uniref:GNAT family N-acetyltransferase n=1 Tax=Streptomonospora mangrovi TaxID=2883123 RepID=A0A9X3SE11_9ACTN|nr:GNAT family N-acetyltransferase [Streptomonospora mangrovi]MDA0563310.1 GNAT family N-acetyltransferase [Streptomonospora mangrovi]
MPTTIRPYTVPADLRAMQDLARRTWSRSARFHVGDLAWQRNQHLGREPDRPTLLWEEAGRVRAWGWVELPGTLDLLVDPARPELADDVLAWFAATATAPRLLVTVLEREAHLVAALERAGYTWDRRAYRGVYMSRSLAGLPRPVLPAGFTARPLRGEADLERRVALHREVWHPSAVTVDSYRNVRAAWPYREDLDWVVEAPGGAFAANCLVWWDEYNRVGELEPVGTAPAFRRAGLGRAVCLAALHALRALGAEEAVVYPVENHPNAEAALPLYRGLGFAPYARTRTYVLER